MTACALSLGLHGSLVASIFLWVDRPSISAEMAGPSVLSVYLNSSYSNLNPNSEPASPDYQSLSFPDSELNSSSAPSTLAAGTDFTLPPPPASPSPRMPPELSNSAEAPPASTRQAASEFPASQLGFDATAPSFQPAVPLSTPKPNYPILARRRGLEGIVLVELDIDNKGIPRGFKIIPPRGSPLLEKSVLASLENFSFIPATSYGQPVPSTLLLKFRFELKD